MSTVTTVTTETRGTTFRPVLDPDAAPQHRFAATGDPEHFQALARRFLGPEVGQVRRIDTVRERYPTAALTALTPDVLARLRAEMEQEAAQ